jgi:hypothetical protein
VEVPDIQFAKSDLSIAYQRYGIGPDVVIIPPLSSNVEIVWEHELWRRVLEISCSAASSRSRIVVSTCSRASTARGVSTSCRSSVGPQRLEAGKSRVEVVELEHLRPGQ